MATSFANGGQLSVSNAEVWNSTEKHGLDVKERRAAVTFAKTQLAQVRMVRTLLERDIEPSQNTIKTVALALESRDELLRMASEANTDFELEKRGILHICREHKLFDHAAQVNELPKRNLDRVTVSTDEARAIEPTLDLNLYGGFYTPSDLTGDIHKFYRGIAKALEAHGAMLNFEAPISDLRAANGDTTLAWKRTAAGSIAEQAHFDAMVICAGVASASLIRRTPRPAALVGCLRFTRRGHCGKNFREDS
jgi:D-amino-acid dehydrogenase